MGSKTNTYWGNLLGDSVDDKYKDFITFYFNHFRKEKLNYPHKDNNNKTASKIIKRVIKGSYETIYLHVFKSLFTKENKEFNKINNIEFIDSNLINIKGKINSFNYKINLDLKNKEYIKNTFGHSWGMVYLKIEDDKYIKSTDLHHQISSYITDMIINGINSEIKKKFRHNRLNKISNSDLELQIGDIFRSIEVNDIKFKEKECNFILSFKSIFNVT